MMSKLGLRGVLVASAAMLLTAAEPNGSAIFKEHCTNCHGDDGKGKAAIGTPDFSAAETQNSITDEQIVMTITDGRKGTIMPAWKGTLTAEEIAAVASYVRSLGPSRDGGKARVQGQAQAAAVQAYNRRRRVH